jgi:hypothetical protein
MVVIKFYLFDAPESAQFFELELGESMLVVPHFYRYANDLLAEYLFDETHMRDQMANDVE